MELTRHVFGVRMRVANVVMEYMLQSVPICGDPFRMEALVNENKALDVETQWISRVQVHL